MKTTYYTFITWEEGAMASGSDGTASGRRQCAMIRQQPEPARSAGSGKVIELDAWQVNDPELFDPEEPDWTLEESEAPEPVLPRPRRNHHCFRSLWSWLTHWRH